MEELQMEGVVPQMGGLEAHLETNKVPEQKTVAEIQLSLERMAKVAILDVALLE